MIPKTVPTEVGLEEHTDGPQVLYKANVNSVLDSHTVVFQSVLIPALIYLPP